MMWTLQDGLEFIRRYQAKANTLNFCLALGGGVLNKGESNHDLDIIVMPMMNAGTTGEYYDLLEWLATFSTELHEMSFNYSTMLIRTKVDGLRVDWFITGQEHVHTTGEYGI